MGLDTWDIMEPPMSGLCDRVAIAGIEVEALEPSKET